MADTGDKIESQADAGTDEASQVKRWWRELHKADRKERQYRKAGNDVVARYRDERRRRNRRYNILYANTETLKPVIYSQTPNPDVRRRYHTDTAPIARKAAEVLERAISFSIDDYEFDGEMEAARDDMLLPGRGVVRVRLENDMEEQRLQETVNFDDQGVQTESTFTFEDEPAEPDEILDDGTPVRNAIVDQRVRAEYVCWEDYRESPAKRWNDVRWLAFRHMMTRRELVDNFDDIGREVELTGEDKTKEDDYYDETTEDRITDLMARAECWEIWDRDNRKVRWITNGLKDRFLEVEDDALFLKSFYTVPEPPYAVKTTDNRIPISHFNTYEDQARELDTTTQRISRLTEALKVRGLYAGVVKEITRFFDTQDDENTLFPVQDWEGIVQRMGGLDNAISWLPIDMIANVLTGLLQQREIIKGEIQEITGISDIMRGETKASETLGAQRIKAIAGSNRLAPMADPFKRMVRDVLRIKGELIAEHFTEQQLRRMTGLQYTDEEWAAIMELLRTENVREYRIDIETDSTVQPDQAVEQQRMTELTAATARFLGEIAPIIAQSPETAPLFMEMLKATWRTAKVGRTMEEQLDQTAASIMQRLQEQQQNPQPDPEMAKAEQDAQNEQGKLVVEQQKNQQDAALTVRQQNIDIAKELMGNVVPMQGFSVEGIA